MLTEAEKDIEAAVRSAGHPAPPSKQPPGQGAPTYVPEGNVKIHNRQRRQQQEVMEDNNEYNEKIVIKAKKQI